MLTLKKISENTDEVLRKLAKRGFDGKEIVAKIISLDATRKETQSSLDANLSEVNSISKQIGGFMKDGKKEEAESAKSKVSGLKEGNKELEETLRSAEKEIQELLWLIPNLPNDIVPEGRTAVEKKLDEQRQKKEELLKTIWK